MFKSKIPKTAALADALINNTSTNDLQRMKTSRPESDNRAENEEDESLSDGDYIDGSGDDSAEDSISENMMKTWIVMMT